MRFILNRLLLAFIVGFPFALRLIRKLLKKQGFSPKLLTTDKLRSHASALGRLGRAVLTNKGSDKTIGPRIRWCDDASASCTRWRAARCAGGCRFGLQVCELPTRPPTPAGAAQRARSNRSSCAIFPPSLFSATFLRHGRPSQRESSRVRESMPSPALAQACTRIRADVTGRVGP